MFQLRRLAKKAPLPLRLMLRAVEPINMLRSARILSVGLRHTPRTLGKPQETCLHSGFGAVPRPYLHDIAVRCRIAAGRRRSGCRRERAERSHVHSHCYLLPKDNCLYYTLFASAFCGEAAARRRNRSSGTGRSVQLPVRSPKRPPCDTALTTARRGASRKSPPPSAQRRLRRRKPCPRRAQLRTRR